MHPTRAAHDRWTPTNLASAPGRAAIVSVIPTTSPQDEKTQDLVKHLRGTVIPEALSGSGVTAEVGGVTRLGRGPSDEDGEGGGAGQLAGHAAQ